MLSKWLAHQLEMPLQRLSLEKKKNTIRCEPLVPLHQEAGQRERLVESTEWSSLSVTPEQMISSRYFSALFN